MTKKLVQFPIRSKDEYDFSYIQFLLQSAYRISDLNYESSSLEIFLLFMSYASIIFVV